MQVLVNVKRRSDISSEQEQHFPEQRRPLHSRLQLKALPVFPHMRFAEHRQDSASQLLPLALCLCHFGFFLF